MIVPYCTNRLVIQSSRNMLPRIHLGTFSMLNYYGDVVVVGDDDDDDDENGEGSLVHGTTSP